MAKLVLQSSQGPPGSMRPNQAPKAGEVAAGGQPGKQGSADAMDGRRRGEHPRLLVDGIGDAVAENGAASQGADQRPQNEDGKRAQHKTSDRWHGAPHL